MSASTLFDCSESRNGRLSRCPAPRGLEERTLGNQKNFLVGELGVNAGEGCGEYPSVKHRLSKSCIDLLASALAIAIADSNVRSSEALIGFTVAVFFPLPCILLLCLALDKV